MSRRVKAIREVVAAAGKPSVISIRQVTLGSVYLEIEGTAPLIQNAFSQKAIEEMLRKHMGISVLKRKKVPARVIDAATIRNEAGVVCFPPTALKKAMLTASVGIKNLKKTHLRPALFIEGNSIPITYEEMKPRMDVTRVGPSRTPDVRFRPEFRGWKARFGIRFADDILSIDTVLDLLQRAGRGGLCEWRPERDGTFGTFHISRAIESQQEKAEIIRACAVAMQSIVIPEWALEAELDTEAIGKLVEDEKGEQESASEDTKTSGGTK